MCAAIAEHGAIHNAAAIGPSNTDRLLYFLDGLYDPLIPENETGIVRANLPCHVVIWNNVSFHHSICVRYGMNPTINT